mgnify:FL=1
MFFCRVKKQFCNNGSYDGGEADKKNRVSVKIIHFYLEYSDFQLFKLEAII